jgi:hypothetical protein
MLLRVGVRGAGSAAYNLCKYLPTTKSIKFVIYPVFDLVSNESHVLGGGGGGGGCSQGVSKKCSL